MQPYDVALLLYIDFVVDLSTHVPYGLCLYILFRPMLCLRLQPICIGVLWKALYRIQDL